MAATITASKGLLIEFKQTIPILRIFDVIKAKEFYCEFLGFDAQWEHHFSDDSPAHIEVQRDGMALHLSEHRGDCTPGSAVFVWMTGIGEFHQEITSKADSYTRLGRLLEPFLQAAIHEPNPILNRQFVDPCIESFGHRCVNEYLLDVVERGDNAEIAGAVASLYWANMQTSITGKIPTYTLEHATPESRGHLYY